MSAPSVIMLLCATPDREGQAVRRLEGEFPGCRITRGSLVPGACVGTAAPLRSVAKRYDGAAPYGGPGPAQLWTVEITVADRVDDPQHLRDLMMSLHEDGLLLDHEAWLPSAPAPDIAP